MFKKYFKRELRSNIFCNEETAEAFIDELSKMGCKWNKDYKEIVVEKDLHLSDKYVVWTYIPRSKFEKAINKIDALDW